MVSQGVHAPCLGTVTSFKRAGLAALKGSSDDDGSCQKRSLDDDKAGKETTEAQNNPINSFYTDNLENL